MKKKTKIIISLAVACAGTLVLAACGTSTPYKELEKQGNNVRVRFDANGGGFSGRADTTIVSFNYRLEDVETGNLRVYAPEDSAHLKDSASVASREGFFLAGWYKGREERKDASGKPLDEYGEVCDEKDQAFIYSDRWDFSKNLALSDMEEEGDSYILTLYAAWIPVFEYRIQMETENGWETVASTTFDPTDSNQNAKREIKIPVWNEETGALDYGYFPTPSLSRENEEGEKVTTALTFENVYASAEKTQPLEAISHDGEIDYEHGIGVNSVVTYYGEFREGNWFRIKKAEQLAKNMRVDGCYEIYDDLDFSEVSWPASVSTGTFGGTIVGLNGVHKISNITVTNSNPESRIAGGLFGRVLASARIEDITFENVTFTLAQGSRFATAQFGLFAGDLDEGATINNVHVTGTFYFGAPMQRFSTATTRVGILTGNSVTDGITYEIEAKVTENAGSKITISTPDENGIITVTVS